MTDQQQDEQPEKTNGELFADYVDGHLDKDPATSFADFFDTDSN